VPSISPVEKDRKRHVAVRNRVSMESDRITQ
jgi:hypothetical protein